MITADEINQWVENGVGAMLLACVSFGVKYIRDMGKRMQEICTQLSILVLKDKHHEERHADLDDKVKDHENRLRAVEAH